MNTKEWNGAMGKKLKYFWQFQCFKKLIKVDESTSGKLKSLEDYFWTSRHFMASLKNCAIDFIDKLKIIVIFNILFIYFEIFLRFTKKFPLEISTLTRFTVLLLFIDFVRIIDTQRSLIQPQQSSTKFTEEKCSPSAMFRVQLNIDFVCVRLW